MIYRNQQYQSKGMGASSVPAIVAASGQIAAGVVPSILVGANILAASSLAVPVIGAAIAGATLAITHFLNHDALYFAQEKATTQIVNQAEVLMKQNLAAWQSSQKTTLDKQQAEANFNALWDQVVKACSDPGFADPGRRCVADRSRGGQWDWFSYYYDPIHNSATHDATIQQATATGSVVDIANTVSGQVVKGIEGLDFSKLLIPALLLGGGLWLAKEF